MAIALWKQFHARIYGELPDCPDPVMDRALRDAAIEVFTATRAWRVSGLNTTTVADQAAYTLTGLPDEAQLVGVPAAWLDDEPMDELLPGQADERDPTCTYDTAISAAPPDGITLSPAPTVDGEAVLLTGAFAPSDDATGIPAQHWHTHHEAIERRAVSQLRRSAGKPWSDPVAAAQAERDALRLMLRAGTLAGPRNARRAMLRVKPL